MKSIKMRGIAAAVTGALLFGFGANAMADSTDDILNALIAKGVLTEEEGVLLMKGRTGEKEAAAKKKESAVTASFKDGIKWESGDKANSMSINGRVQLDHRNYDQDAEGTAANDKVADTFDIRRAYLGAKGTFNKYYDWEVTADFAGQTNTSHLDVAYMNIKWWEQAQFQFGQFKMPFSLEERTSSRFIDFQERSFVNNSSLTPGKERGAMIHGTPFKGFNYALAFSTGQGKNTNETDHREDSKDTIVHVDANLAEMLGYKDSVIHVGASYANGDLPPAVVGAQRTEGRGVEFFGITTTTGTKMERTRQGFETALAYGPVKFQGEYSKANFDGKTTGGVSYDRDIDAYYAEVLWLVTGENYSDSYKKGKFDRIKPKNDFDPEFKNGLGAFELGIRYSKFDASDFKTTNATGTGILGSGKTNEADAYTIGLKWLPTANSRFLLNYVKTDFDTPVLYATGGKSSKDDKTIMLRAQYDF
jgi:phosphate-selective porin OprO and OprP